MSMIEARKRSCWRERPALVMRRRQAREAQCASLLRGGPLGLAQVILRSYLMQPMPMTSSAFLRWSALKAA
jgi:hypothetical protein